MKIKFILSFFLVTISMISFAQDAATTRKKQFNLENGLAISGYDPVSYFRQNKAIKGQNKMAVNHQGATYYFSNPGNAEEFKKNPAKYEPQYGGWCAYAMGKDGAKVEIDPETFKIIDGKLYVFYNKFFNNTLKTWNKDEVALRKHADANWQKFYP